MVIIVIESPNRNRRAALRAPRQARSGRTAYSAKGHNVTVGGGPAPVRAYIPEFLPDILEGRIQPGRVFDRTVDLDGVPGGYRDMNDRKALKVMVRP